MKNFIRIMLLPVFLLTSLVALAKVPVSPAIVGIWNADIVYLDKTFKGKYTFNLDGTMSQSDNLVFSADWQHIYNLANAPQGIALPIFDRGLGTWELTAWGGDFGEKVVANYVKKAKVANSTVYKQEAELKLGSVKGNSAKGKLVIVLTNSAKQKKTISDITVVLKRAPIQY